jgi:hypothetical protein
MAAWGHGLKDRSARHGGAESHDRRHAD